MRYLFRLPPSILVTERRSRKKVPVHGPSLDARVELGGGGPGGGLVGQPGRGRRVGGVPGEIPEEGLVDVAFGTGEGAVAGVAGELEHLVDVVVGFSVGVCSKSFVRAVSKNV
jgi:hypothetical protein